MDLVHALKVGILKTKTKTFLLQIISKVADELNVIINHSWKFAQKLLHKSSTHRSASFIDGNVVIDCNYIMFLPILFKKFMYAM